MRIAGIIAEYNPLHNGHIYHMEQARAQAKAEACIVILSGNFVQRGEPACTDKLTRTEWALKAGADIVLELPSIYATANAERFAIAFANSAYMAIPLIRAGLGEEATFYATAIIAVFLTFHWTYGIAELGGGFNIAKLTKNPCIISIVLGLLIFWFQIPLPTPIIDTVRLVGGLTTPLSMIIAGIFLSDLKLSDLCDLRIYRIAIIRNIIVPMVFIGVILLTGCAGWFESARIVAIASVYSCSCASAVSVILMSAALGKEALHASKLVAVSTIMSLATLPLMAAVADMLIK